MNRIPIEDEIVALRRDLHRHPELSGQETRTAGIVAACAACGLFVRIPRCDTETEAAVEAVAQ